MNQYEALYIIDVALDEETNRSVIEKFKGIVEANGGEVTDVNEWGKRKLAYAIDYKTEGYYVLMSFASAPELPKELERNYKNDERILRYMVTRKEA
ncbi:MAG: 30S ribosomal protein S6 [Clostridia bacterium]|nr:30S ribosomal protein S6 [Clostridia bacterium]